MATTETIGGDGKLFVGDDMVFELELLVPRTDGLPHDATSIVENMTGWVLLFDVRKKDTSPDPAILSKTPTITGVFNAVRSVNTQRAVVVVTDTEMNLFKQQTYRYSWKRMDDGSERVLCRGDFAPEKATAP
jgi:hypothetical protein